MRSRAAMVAGVCALAAMSPASALAKAHHHKHHHKKKPVTYYVALGDSLARGAQPNSAGTTVPTSNGYANDIYTVEKKHFKHLKLELLGCLGETTTSMVEGTKGGSPCTYKAGSQLAAAVKFIKKHKVAFVTLDIGANDIDGCVVDGAINGTCLAAGSTALGANVPTIVAALRKATGAKTPIVGMTYYDPFLADYLTGSYGQALAGDSVVLAKQVNGTLSTDFAAQQLKIADVATAFDTYGPFTQTATLPGVGTVPEPVAEICALTYMCAPAPVGPNIHATTAGYGVIAKTFEAAL